MYAAEERVNQQLSDVDLEIAREFVARAREQGASMTGPDFLLQALTKSVGATAPDKKSEPLG